MSLVLSSDSEDDSETDEDDDSEMDDDDDESLYDSNMSLCTPTPTTHQLSTRPANVRRREIYAADPNKRGETAASALWERVFADLIAREIKYDTDRQKLTPDTVEDVDLRQLFKFHFQFSQRTLPPSEDIDSLLAKPATVLALQALASDPLHFNPAKFPDAFERVDDSHNPPYCAAHQYMRTFILTRAELKGLLAILRRLHPSDVPRQTILQQHLDRTAGESPDTKISIHYIGNTVRKYIFFYYAYLSLTLFHRIIIRPCP